MKKKTCKPFFSTDMLLILAGVSLGVSVKFPRIWQKILCLAVAFILIIIRNYVIRKRMKEEFEEIIKRGEENG